MAEIIQLTGDSNFEWNQVEKILLSYFGDPEKSKRVLEKFKPVWMYIHRRQKKISCQVVVDCLEGPGLSDYQADMIRRGVYKAFREIQSEFDLILNEVLNLLFELYFKLENNR